MNSRYFVFTAVCAALALAPVAATAQVDASKVREAVETATDAIDKLHATASSHHRVMIVELM